MNFSPPLRNDANALKPSLFPPLKTDTENRGLLMWRGPGSLDCRIRNPGLGQALGTAEKRAQGEKEGCQR